MATIRRSSRLASALASAAPAQGISTTLASNVAGLNRWKYCAVNGIDPTQAANDVASGQNQPAQGFPEPPFPSRHQPGRQHGIGFEEVQQ